MLGYIGIIHILIHFFSSTVTFHFHYDFIVDEGKVTNKVQGVHKASFGVISDNTKWNCSEKCIAAHTDLIFTYYPTMW